MRDLKLSSSAAAPAEGKQGGRGGPEDQQPIQQRHKEKSFPRLGEPENTGAEGMKEMNEWMDGGGDSEEGIPKSHPKGLMHDFVEG